MTDDKLQKYIIKKQIPLWTQRSSKKTFCGYSINVVQYIVLRWLIICFLLLFFVIKLNNMIIDELLAIEEISNTKQSDSHTTNSPILTFKPKRYLDNIKPWLKNYWADNWSEWYFLIGYVTFRIILQCFIPY